jgi:hypothetical protein
MVRKDLNANPQPHGGGSSIATGFNRWDQVRDKLSAVGTTAVSRAATLLSRSLKTTG